MMVPDKPLLWKSSAILLGVALPLALVGKGLVAAALLLGLIAGLMATHGESLRATIRLVYESRFTLLVSAFLMALAVGVAWGINPPNSADKWLQMAGLALGAGLLFVVLREMPGRYVELLLDALLLALLILGVVAAVDALTGNVYLASALHGADKATTPYRLNAMSSLLAVLAPLAWARLLVLAREHDRLTPRMALVSAVFLFVVLIVAGGRAGWVGGVLALAVFAALAARYHGLNIHRRHYGGFVLVVLGALAVYALAFGWEFMWQRASIIGEANVGRGMMSGRLDVWMKALQHIPDMPLFGIGLMNYRYLPNAIDLHPHNWLLQMLLEAGVVGTALFLAILMLIFQTFWAFARGNIYAAAAFAGLVGFVISGLANTSIFRWDWLVMMIFVVALGYRAGWSGEGQKKRRKNKLVQRDVLAPPRLRKP